jgi:hypothetical protein
MGVPVKIGFEGMHDNGDFQATSTILTGMAGGSSIRVRRGKVDDGLRVLIPDIGFIL